MRSSGMNRRRFLVLVGGAGGSWLAAACGRDDIGADGGSLGSSGSSPSQDSAAEAPPSAATGLRPSDADGWVDEAGVAVVAVEPGLVDMTGWQGEFLTLRPDPAGMMVRSESTGRDYAVAVPDGFAGRCMGAHGDLLAVCGHRVVHTGYMTFEAGTPYEELLDQAGPHAGLLVAQPNRPDVRPYRHEFIERFPALIVTDNLLDWELFDLSLHAGTGGSLGAVVERGGVLAADHYAFAEVPDSVFEASLISLGDAVAGRVSAVPGAVPVDHGSLWGAGDTGTSGLVVVADRRGVRAYDDERQPVLSIDDDAALLGIDASGGLLDVAVETSDGRREIRRFRGGVQQAAVGMQPSDPIRHRVSEDVTVVSANGKQSMIPNSSIADGPRTPQ